MIVIWNAGAVAQLEQGYGQSVWNWSGPDGEAAPSGFVLALARTAPRVSAAARVRPRVLAAARVVERVEGDASVGEA